MFVGDAATAAVRAARAGEFPAPVGVASDGKLTEAARCTEPCAIWFDAAACGASSGFCARVAAGLGLPDCRATAAVEGCGLKSDDCVGAALVATSATLVRTLPTVAELVFPGTTFFVAATCGPDCEVGCFAAVVLGMAALD